MASREPQSFLKMRPLSRRERVLLVFLVLVAWGVCFFFFVYQPFTEEIGVLRKDLEVERSKLESARAILHQLEAIEARIAELTASMEQLDLLVPGDNRVPHFLYSCWEWERLTGARVFKMAFKAPNDGEGYEEYVVDFIVGGTYAAHVKFLAKLEEMNRLVRVDSMALMPEDPFGVEEGPGAGAGGGEGGSEGASPPDSTSFLPTSDAVTARYSVHLFVDPAKAEQAAAETPGEGLIFTLSTGRKTPFLP